MSKKFFAIFLLMVVGISIIARLLPHPPNFAPIAALALFCGVYASRVSKWYLLTPIAAMFVSDLFVGFYEWKTMAVVYGSFFAIGLIGLLVRMFEAKLQTVALGTLAGSSLFYLTTNFAVWAFSGMYDPTLDGLLLSYTMALPFLKFTLLGDLFYTGLFFGVYAFVQSPALRSVYKGVGIFFVALLVLPELLHHEPVNQEEVKQVPHILDPVRPQIDRNLPEISDSGTSSTVSFWDEQGRLRVGIHS